MGTVGLTDILEKVTTYQPAASTDLIHRAYVYASDKHDGQFRKSGEPYFVHPTSVASIIAEMKLDTASVCAALLHDVVEDTETSEDDIAEHFGEEVAFLVGGVTKLGRLDFGCKEDQQAESFRKMLVAMARDIRVLLVKLADRLDNMRTLGFMKVASQERIARETLDIYAPLAGRLGIHWLKAELEDLSFKYTHPDSYRELASKVAQAARDGDRYVQQTVKELQTILSEHVIDADVQGRTKHLYSIWRKMRVKNLDFEQVQDLVAFRVMVPDIPSCYAGLGVIHAKWTPVPGRFKDFIALPKPNMYQSLHTTVIGPSCRKVEVQIRTREMHRTAELGIAAHWKYKQHTGGLEKKDLERFSWLRQLLEFQKDVQDPAEFLDSVRVDLFADEVYVFTPKGDVYSFPRGATPVDFAFAVHSEVGFRCVGSKVNGQMVPLRHQLKSGDVVEILTSASQRPNKQWLDFAVTGRARSRIRSFIRGQEREKSAKLGRELLERAVHKRGLSYQKFFKTLEGEKLHRQYKLNSHDELLSQVGYGKLSAQQVAERATLTKTNGKDVRPSLVERAVRSVTRKEESAIVVEGIDNVLVRFGKCCSPVPGDAITGWITRGRGVTVHRRDCARSMELDHQRRVDVTWGASAKIRLPVNLRVVTNDQPGILADVSAALTDAKLNIHQANCRTGEAGRAVNDFSFEISDVNTLRSVIREISRIDGVLEVVRT